MQNQYHVPIGGPQIMRSRKEMLVRTGLSASPVDLPPPSPQQQQGFYDLHQQPPPPAPPPPPSYRFSSANGQISDQDSHPPPPPQANQQTYMHPPPPPNRPGQFINNPDRRGFFDNNSMTESGSKRSLSASPPPPPPLHPPRKELPFSPASEEDAKHFFDHRKQRQRGQYERIHASDSRLRSKSASDSSSDMFFMERRKSSNRPRKVPRNFKFKGSIDVQTMSRDFRKVPCERLCWSEGTMRPPIHPPMPPCIRFPPQPPSSIGLMNCSAPFFDRGASCGEGSRFCAGSSNQFAPPPPQVLLQPPAPLNSSSAHQLSPLPQSPPHHHQQQQYHPAYRPGKSGYPPIPPGAKIVAQYVTEMSDEQRIAGQSTREPPFHPMPYSNVHPSFPIGINNNPMYRGTETPMIFPLPQQQIRFPNMGRTSCIPPPCETIVETCVPSKKTIDIYEKKKKRCARPDYTLEFDKLRDDIINSLTTEFRKLDFRREPLAVDKEVKVIVQPIQPVFYVPQKSTGGGDGGGSSSNQQPVAPTVIYVPRNVYVPVIKPVFVPRERVIVRPQIVHVARPVVIDRPVPVCQRPIVIDRERPTPYPVRVPVAHHTSHEHFSSSAAVEGTVNEQYVFADNVPNAYGGRTGEFAYGLNYGYEPKDDRYRYIISGCDYSGPVHTEILNGAESVSQQQQRNIDDDDETLHHLHHHHLLHHQQQQHNRADLGRDIVFPRHRKESVAKNGVIHQLDHQHLQHTHHHRTQPNVDQPAPPNRFDAAVDAELFNGESEQNSSSSADGTSHSSTSSSNKPRFEILDPSLKSSWQPIDQDILIQRYGQTAKEITEISERFGNKSDPNHGICRCPNSSDGLPISNSTDYHTKRPIIRDEILKKADKQTAHNVLIYRDFSIRA